MQHERHGEERQADQRLERRRQQPAERADARRQTDGRRGIEVARERQRAQRRVAQLRRLERRVQLVQPRFDAVARRVGEVIDERLHHVAELWQRELALIRPQQLARDDGGVERVPATSEWPEGARRTSPAR